MLNINFSYKIFFKISFLKKFMEFLFFFIFKFRAFFLNKILKIFFIIFYKFNDFSLIFLYYLYVKRKKTENNRKKYI